MYICVNVFYYYYCYYYLLKDEQIKVLNTTDFCSTEDGVGRWEQEKLKAPQHLC